jgi:hypothetical protein
VKLVTVFYLDDATIFLNNGRRHTKGNKLSDFPYFALSITGSMPPKYQAILSCTDFPCLLSHHMPLRSRWNLRKEGRN